MGRKRIGEILVQAGVLEEAGLRAALNEQRRWGGHLGQILVDMRLVTEEVLVKALSAQLNFPIIDLDRLDIAPEVLALVTAEMAEENSVIPVRVEGKFLDVAMSNPINVGIIDELRIRTQLNVRPYLAGPYMVQRALGRFYNRTAQIDHVGARDPSMRSSSLQASGLKVLSESEAGLSEEPRDDDDDNKKTLLKRPPTGIADLLEPEADDDEAAAMQAAEIRALQQRISALEALVSRDEDVLRKLLALLVEKGLATREEILERIR